MKKEINIISYMIFTLVLVFGLTMSASFLLAAAWNQPVTDPPNGGLVKPVPSESGNSMVYYTPKSVEVDGKFMVGTDDLVVDTSNNKVGIGTDNPQTELDVDGPVKLGNFASFPTCDINVVGAFFFNTSDNMPYVCDNFGAWQQLHADINDDGKW